MKDKIAFLILAHNNPEMLKRLIYSLDYELFDIYVHIDAKTDISLYGFDSYRLKYSKLYIVDKRLRVYWADYSVVKATIELMKFALRKNNYCRFVMLSGNDYPLKSNIEIYDKFSNNNIEFIMGTPLQNMEKISKYHFMHYGPLGKRLEDIYNCLGIHYNSKPLIVDENKYTVFFAPQWHALSFLCVTAVLDTYERNQKVLDKFFMYTYAPDELLIPTLVFNSKFKNKTLKSSFPDGTHYNIMTAIHYIDYEPIVRVLTENDANNLLSSNKLFARKFNVYSSAKLLDFIDKQRNKI